jgi:hypothetical protein
LHRYNDPKHANLWLFGGFALAALCLLFPNEWYPQAGILWNIYNANIQSTTIPVRAGLALAVLIVLWGLYLRTSDSKPDDH